jgi:hypothetical protein
MKRLVLFLFLASGALSSVAWPAVTQPADGSYQSTDIGGPVYTGYFSESWVGNSPGHGGVGNTFIVASVDGPAVATQWEVWCASVSAPPVLLEDTRDGDDTGEVTWITSYDSGFFWLFGEGPWGQSGADDFHGTTGAMEVKTTYTYELGVITLINSVITVSGAFDPGSWDGECLELTATSVVEGTTESGSKPEDYPAFMESGCNPPATQTGAWGYFGIMTLEILDCTSSPVESTTWGAVKSLYAN